MANNNALNDTVTITVRQSGAVRTLRAMTGLQAAIEDVEVAALNMSDTLDSAFDMAGLIAYENRLQRVTNLMQNMQPAGMSQEFRALMDHLDEMEDTSRHMLTHLESMSTDIRTMAHDTDLIARNSDDAADEFRDSARYTGETANNLREQNEQLRNQRREQNTQRRRTRRSEGLAGQGSSRNQGRSISKMLSNAGGLAAMYAVVTANVYAATEGFRLLSAAASDSRLLEVSNTLSASKGANVIVAADEMRSVLEGSISVQESMRLATASISKGFSTEQLSELTLVARRASVALGIDLTDAMNRVTKGIAKQEIELLDELGITIKLTEAFDAYALTIGVSADNLSSAQRQQALYNLVTKKSVETLGSIDGVMKATEWEQFGARASSTINKMAQELTDTGSILSNVLAGINSYMGPDTLDLDSKITSLTSTLKAAYLNTSEGLAPGVSAALAFKKALAPEALLKEYNNLGSRIHSITSEMAQVKKLMEEKDWDTSAEEFAQATALGVRLAGLEEEREITQQRAEALREQVKQQRILQGLGLSSYSSEADNYLDKTVSNASITQLEKTDVLLTNIRETASGAKDNLDLFTKATLKASDSQPLDNTISMGRKLLEYIDEVRSAALEMNKVADGEVTVALALSASNLGSSEKAVRTYLDQLTAHQQAKLEITQVELENAQAIEQTKNAYADLSEVQKFSNDSLSKYTDEVGIQILEKTMAAKKAAWEAEKAILKDKAVKAEKQKAFDKQAAEDATKLATLYIAQANAQYQLGKMKTAVLHAENDAIQKSLSLQGKVTLKAEAQYAVSTASRDKVTAQEEYDQANLAFAREGRLANDTALKGAAISLVEAGAVLEEAKKLLDDVDINKRATVQNQALGTLGGTTNVGTALGGTDPNEGQAEQQQLALQASNMTAAGDAMSYLIGYTPGLDTMSSSLTNLATVATTMGLSVESGTSMAISGLQAMGGMLQMVSQGAVSEIDHQIDMEKKRDGSSKESLAKIKQLEAEKIEEQKKAARQQIIISTAVATMNALASAPFPLNLALAGAAVLAGGLALAQANSASANSLESLNTEPNTNTTDSITLGERDSSVDLARSANMGEHEYLTGGKGSGNSGSFVPRSTGGRGSANTSILLGENGPELVSFTQDTNITPNESLGNSSGSNVTYNVTIEAIDSQSFLDRKEEIFEAFEAQAQQQGMDVGKLRA